MIWPQYCSVNELLAGRWRGRRGLEGGEVGREIKRRLKARVGERSGGTEFDPRERMGGCCGTLDAGGGSWSPLGDMKVKAEGGWKGEGL